MCLPAVPVAPVHSRPDWDSRREEGQEKDRGRPWV